MHAQTNTLVVKLLMVGKIGEAIVLAGAAYREEDEFKELTGVSKAKLINDQNHYDTHVSCHHSKQSSYCCHTAAGTLLCA